MKKHLHTAVQGVLISFSLVLHAVTVCIAESYPLVSRWLFIISIVSWFSILTTWLIGRAKRSSTHQLKRLTSIWTSFRQYVERRSHKTTNAVPVSSDQLAQLRSDVQRLILALYGLTPEMEEKRCKLQGGTFPLPALLPQNATLYTEFTGVVRFLNHYGFPQVESIRLHYNDFTFVQAWISDLGTCFLQAQSEYQYNQRVMEWTLREACSMLDALSTHSQNRVVQVILLSNKTSFSFLTRFSLSTNTRASNSFLHSPLSRSPNVLVT